MRGLFFAAMLLFLLGGVSVQAQSVLRKNGVGMNIGYGGFNENAGIGVHARLYLNDGFRMEPTFNYYFENDDWSQWDIMANFHYVFSVANKVGLYPLVGIGVAGNSVHDHSKASFSMNFGGGVEVPVSREFTLGGELKGQFIGWDALSDKVEFVPTFKMTYCF